MFNNTTAPSASRVGRCSSVWCQIPNALTTLRIFCTIGMCLWPVRPVLVFVLSLCGAMSDALDGYVAKKFGWSSTFGKRYDQYADWFFGIGILYAIYCAEGLTWYAWPWNVALLTMIGGYLVIRTTMPGVDTNGAARLKTLIQFTGGVTILGSYALEWDGAHAIGYIIVWISVILMAKSLWNYLKLPAK